MKKRVKIILIISIVILILVISGFLIYNQFFSENSNFEYNFDYSSLGVMGGGDAGGEIGQQTSGNVFADIKLNPFENES